MRVNLSATVLYSAGGAEVNNCFHCGLYFKLIMTYMQLLSIHSFFDYADHNFKFIVRKGISNLRFFLTSLTHKYLDKYIHAILYAEITVFLLPSSADYYFYLDVGKL